MEFEIFKYADVSNEFIEPNDLDLILCPDAPNHLANHDEKAGSFFYTPDKETLDHFVAEARAFGFSERFIKIMKTLSVQEVGIVRFDADGGAVKGLDPCQHA